MTHLTHKQAPVSVLLTGFSAFPGAPVNPTEDLALALHRRRASFARYGIKLETRVLPVVYSAIGPAIARHARALAPDVILHFGLAAERSWISIEMLARNRVNTMYPDAAGHRSKNSKLMQGGPSKRRARVPVAEIAAALRCAGYPCRLSKDAGDYLCNAAFYLSLATPYAPHVGFIHVPPLRAQEGRFMAGGRSNLTLPQLVRAAERAIVTAAAAARRARVAQKPAGRAAACLSASQ